MSEQTKYEDETETLRYSYGHIINLETDIYRHRDINQHRVPDRPPICFILKYFETFLFPIYLL